MKHRPPRCQDFKVLVKSLFRQMVKESCPQTTEGVARRNGTSNTSLIRVQELCESGGGRPGLSVLMSLTVFVDVKQH